ncbi:MAG: asparaginase [Candidatus Gastranaerophilales bacterium]|nr:asparaginase [Candidatus Gastranaerophilales bacterium]
MLPKYALLTRNIRCELFEEEHFGLIYAFDKNKKTVNKIGNDNGYGFCMRSCMKPLQFAAVSEIIKEFGLTDEEIAVACASHTGEKEHCDAVLSILKKCGLTEKDLLCPPLEPLSKTACAGLIKNDLSPSAIHNNCSGKHAAILAYCMLAGYPIKDYNSVSHPVQKKILNFVAKNCEIELKDCIIAKDGCTLPVLSMPLENFAKGFLNIFTDNKYDKIRQAIINNPYLYGGRGRLDSEIVAAAKGRLIAKVGAGNLCCIVDMAENKSFIIKMADGDNFHRALAAVEFLNRLNYFSKEEFSRLSALYSPLLTDENGEIVGKTEFCF